MEYNTDVPDGRALMGETKMPNLAVRGAVSIDRSKPLVLEYFDTDAAILDHLRTRLPHVPKTTIKFNRVYVSADKNTSRFRVNYWADTGDGIYPTQQIIHSLYVEVLAKDGRIVTVTVR